MTAARVRTLPTRKAAPTASDGGEAPPDEGPRLRLAASRGTLGLELDAPFAIGPLRLTTLSLSFPNIRFPIDLTGGVSRFRHRRGSLTRLAVEANIAEVAAWAAPRLRGVLRSSTPEVWLSAMEGGFAVGLSDGESALAFDVLVLPGGAGLTFVPERARGIGLGAPPQTLAVRAVAAALGSLVKMDGGGLVAPFALGALLRAALPFAGARAHSVEGAAWDVPQAAAEHLTLSAVSEEAPPALPDRLIRAGEVLGLTAEAEDAAYRGNTEAGRDLYLLALERAPRHPEISERLAWLDLVAGDRPEAALSTLIDVMPAIDAGLLGAELLGAVGDSDGSRTALGRAAAVEPFGPLAARAWLRAAALAEDVRERLAALDEAVTRAPALADARWARLDARLAAADSRGALADAQHLEAAARGARARHEIARRAARAFLEEGFPKEAHRLFERALRYAPDDAEAVAGLARALSTEGAPRRALDLFARALGLAERSGGRTEAVTVDLARALVEVADDRPAAIARVRAISASAPEAAEARLLEARWRAELGDFAGAGLAVGRLRDHAERNPLLGGVAPAPGSAASARAEALAALLVEAANIDERFRDDLAGAQRDLGLALRLLPRDSRVAAAFRRVARENVRRSSAEGGGATGSGSPTLPQPPRRATATTVKGPAPRRRSPSTLPPAPPRDLDEPSAVEEELPLSMPPPLREGRLQTDARRQAGARFQGDTPQRGRTPSPLPQPLEPDSASDDDAQGPATDFPEEEEWVDLDALPSAPLDNSEDSPSAPWRALDALPPAPPHEETVATSDNDEDEALAERLSEKVRANPNDRVTVIALCGVLERLGRDLELLAVLSARMDEGAADEVATLSPRRRAVLRRLAERARAAGSPSEAELYEMMLAAGPG